MTPDKYKGCRLTTATLLIQEAERRESRQVELLGELVKALELKMLSSVRIAFNASNQEYKSITERISREQNE